MIIQTFVCGPLENNTYAIVCEKIKRVVVIDPAFGAKKKIEKFLEKNEYVLEKILLTHGHWDHITDVVLLKEEFSCPVFLHQGDWDLLENPQKSSFFSAITVPHFKPDFFLQDNDKIKLGDITISVIHTPGHTPGCVCLYIEKEKILFSGDTLFKGSFGRVDFPYSSAENMIKSLKRLSNLPKDVKVYPGHGSETTIGRENWIMNPEKFIN